MAERLRRPAIVGTVCLGLLLAGLIIDLSTQQILVIAIVYNVPIALTGVANSRRLTVWTTVFALAANVAAAYENNLTFASYDRSTVLNRVLSALSFLIVGAMTLAREGAVGEVEELERARDDAERERSLRRFITALSVPMGPEALISRATTGLCELLAADVLVVATLRDGRFAAPRWTSGSAGGLAEPGTSASWAVESVPLTEHPAITLRSEAGRITTGLWRREGGDDLVVVASLPGVRHPSTVLGEALHGLCTLLHRADAAAGDDGGSGGDRVDEPSV